MSRPAHRFLLEFQRHCQLHSESIMCLPHNKFLHRSLDPSQVQPPLLWIGHRPFARRFSSLPPMQGSLVRLVAAWQAVVATRKAATAWEVVAREVWQYRHPNRVRFLLWWSMLIEHSSCLRIFLVVSASLTALPSHAPLWSSQLGWACASYGHSLRMGVSWRSRRYC